MEMGKAFVDEVVVGARHRPLDPSKVDALAQSIKAIGLQHPITVYADGENREHLVAGLHRLEAFRKLEIELIPVVYVKMTEVDRELWEIAENLHRVDLTKEQRDEHIRRYAELLEAREAEAILGQNDPVLEKRGRGQPKGTAAKVADATGLSKKTVRRALKQPDPDEERRREENREAVKRRQEIDKASRAACAEEYAEWLLENSDLGLIPTLITWIEGSDPKAVIAALRREHVRAA